MTYATIADVTSVIPDRDLQRLTDRDGAIDAVNEAVLQEALDDAAAEIDGWISKRVKQPLDPIPRMLLLTCRDLAIWRLHANVGAVPEPIEKLRAAALEWLKAVSEGRVSIGDETPGDGAPASPGMVLEDGAPPVFTRDTMNGF